MIRNAVVGLIALALISGCTRPESGDLTEFAGGKLSVGNGDITFDRPVCADEFLHTGTQGGVEARLTPDGDLWAGAVIAPAFLHRSAQGCPLGSVEFRKVYPTGLFRS